MAELRAALPGLEAAAKPAAAKNLLDLLSGKSVVYAISDMPAEGWENFFDAHMTALDGMPLASVEDAFRRWDRAELTPDKPGQAAFYPRPAQLYTLAKTHRESLEVAVYRGRKALEGAPEVREVWTDERRAAIKAEAVAAGVLTADGKLAVKIGAVDPSDDRFRVEPKHPGDDVEAI